MISNGMRPSTFPETGYLHVIDLQTSLELSAISLGHLPNAIDIAPSGIAYVVCSQEGIVIPVDINGQMPHSPIKVGNYPVAVR